MPRRTTGAGRDCSSFRWRNGNLTRDIRHSRETQPAAATRRNLLISWRAFRCYPAGGCHEATKPLSAMSGKMRRRVAFVSLRSLSGGIVLAPPTYQGVNDD